MSRIAALADDLRAEHEALDARVAPLDEQGWSAPTPAEGWSVRDQISHLCYFDGTALLAITDPDAFQRHVEEALGGEARPDDTGIGRSTTGEQLLGRWREGRGALLDAIRGADDKARVPWYGPAMSLASFVTARLMEIWAHGQDVADGLGLSRQGD